MVYMARDDYNYHDGGWCERYTCWAGVVANAKELKVKHHKYKSYLDSDDDEEVEAFSSVDKHRSLCKWNYNQAGKDSLYSSDLDKEYVRMYYTMRRTEDDSFSREASFNSTYRRDL